MDLDFYFNLNVRVSQNIETSEKSTNEDNIIKNKKNNNKMFLVTLQTTWYFTTGSPVMG